MNKTMVNRISLMANFCLVVAVLLLVFRSPKHIIVERPDHDRRIKELQENYKVLENRYDSISRLRSKTDTIEVTLIKWRTRELKAVETANEKELDSIIKSRL